MGRRIFPTRRQLRSFRLSPAALVGVFVTAGLLVVANIGMTSTAANVIEPTSIIDYNTAASLNDLRPTQCVTHGVDVSAIVSGGANVVGGGADELVLADASTVSMDGGAGDDCIVASPGASIDGGAGINDVCIGQVATVMTNCEHEYKL